MVEEATCSTENSAHGDVVPMPTMPALPMLLVVVTMKLVAVEEPIAKAGPAPMPFGLMESCPHGDVVPNPPKPALVMRKLVAVEEPTANWLAACPATGFTASCAHGVVLPTPTLPRPLM